MIENENLTSLNETLMIKPDEEPDFVLEKEKSPIMKFLTNNYLHFMVKKLFFYFLVFFIALSIAFIIPRLLPGDPIRQLLSNEPADVDMSSEYMQQKYDALLKYFGLDTPLLNQYWTFLTEFFSNGNLGLSYRKGFNPVTEVVAPYAVFTMVLAIPALFISFFLGNKVGGLLAFNPTRGNRYIFNILVFAQALPFFWIGYLLLEIFVNQLQIVPIEYPIMPLTFANSFDALTRYWTPLLILLLAHTGGWSTGMRSMVIYELDQDYIQYLKKLGYSNTKLRDVASRNAILPQFTGLNLRLGGIIGQSLILEMIFLWPGLGRLMIDANFDQDYPLIIGTFLYVIIIVVGNYFVDVMYGILDPRIRTGKGDE